MTEHSRGIKRPREGWDRWTAKVVLILLALGVWSLIGAFVSVVLLAFWAA